MRQALTSLAEILGAISISTGAFYINPAAGFITSGGFLIAGGALAART